MTWIIILAVIGVIIFIAASGSAPDKKANTSRSRKKEEIPSVSQLVNTVKTLDDLKKLKQKYQRAEQACMNNTTDNSNIEKRYHTFEEAYWKATDKTFFYQYTPTLDLETPLDVLENAFKIIPISEYEKQRSTIGGDDNDWIELSASDYQDKNYETKPTYLSGLIEYQSIINQKASYEERIEKLNQLGKKQRAFKNEFSYGETEPFGVIWIKDILRRHKVPLVDKLFELGFDSPTKLAAANLEELSKLEGFGPKKLEALKKAIDQIKHTIE